MNDEDLCHLSLQALRRHYLRGTLSPVDVIEAFIRRIDTINPRLNVYVHLTAESARRKARVAEKTLRRGGTDAPALCGIPFSVKDTLPTAGVRTTFGSRLFAEFVPEESAAAVDTVERAGGILLGKTNSPALGWIGVTQNKLFGATRNPWQPEVTCGGSSGGAAVAAAMALAPLNIGTDGGGSLRIPGSFTGTVGFKPSYGRVPNYPTGPNWGLQHIGPIARTVEDAAVALDVLAQPDPRDPYSLPPSQIRFASAIRRRPERLRIAFSTDLGYAESVDPEVIDICRDALKAFRTLGHRVTEEALQWPSPMEFWQTLFVAGVAHRLGPFAEQRPQDIEDKLLEFIEAGRRLAPDAYYKAWLAKNDWWQRVVGTFDRFDLLVTPTVACPPFAIGRETVGSIAGKPVSFYGWSPFTVPFNASGQPAISVPAGTTRDGLPVGLQIVGRRFADDLVLAAAAAFEKERPWPTRVPA